MFFALEAGSQTQYLKEELLSNSTPRMLTRFNDELCMAKNKVAYGWDENTVFEKKS